MKNGLKIGIVVGIVVLLIVVLIGGSYNSLVTKEEEVDNKLADISAQLQRRTDLIPNLLETVKGYASHETEVINSITSSREKLLSAKGVEEKAEANEELTSALNNLFVIVENYPDLKASESFTKFQDELAGTENRIAVARRDYNDAVASYNKVIKSFPKNILAGIFGFDKKEYFEASENANKVPEVSFE